MPNIFAKLCKPAKMQSQLPDHVWALCFMKLNAGDIGSMSPEELTQFLNQQAEQASAATQTLYTCALDGQQVLPLFSTLEMAKQFSQVMYRRREKDSPETTIMAFTIIRMTRAALSDKLRTNESLVSILDLATPEERRLSRADFDQE